MIEDSQSIDTITSSKFHQLIYKLDPGFIMPSQETVNSIIYITYNSSFQQLQQLIKNEAISVSLAMDLWKSKNNQGFLGTTCSFLDRKFELHEITLDVAYVKYPYTAEDILDALEDVLARWKIEDLIFTVTTSNKSNIKKVMKEVNWLGCIVDTLQLVIEKGTKPAEVLIARANHYANCIKQNKFLEVVEKIVSIF